MKIFKFFSLLTFAALCLGFSACKDDNAGPTDKLIGTWEAYWLEGWYTDSANPGDNEEINQAVDPDELVTMTFNQNHTGSNSEGGEFTWEQNGDLLTIRIDPTASETGKIVKLTNSELIMEQYMKYGTVEEYLKITFRRR